ncbi:glycosyltransferase [Pseudoalteromonas nigrifaciens]|uniref:glycosyltransferase n=1 Tax=Pseudoalteromonas nigrifaciens TaxID=28109 RepID=UPI003FD3D297
MHRKNKKTAILINSLSCGGAEKVASILAEEILDVKWVCKIIPTKNFFHINRDDIEIIELGFYSGKSNFLKLINYFYAMFYFCFFIIKNKPKVILSFLHAAHIISYTSRCIKKNIERVYCERSLIKESYVGIKRKIMIGIMRKIAKSGSLFISISNEVLNGLKDNGIIPLAHSVIYNPIEDRKINSYVDLKRESCNRVRLVTVSRLSKIKNINFLLDFIKINYSDYELHIIGDGPEFNTLKDYSLSLGISDYVFFYGSISEPFELAINFDVFVYSSKYESFGNVCIESASYGLPVVLPNPCGALFEVFSYSKKSGSMFYDSNNLTSLKNTLDLYKCNESLKLLNSNLLFTYSKKFTKNSIINNYIEEIYYS